MLLSGFTIVRNGLKFGYPFCESIASALPICDEFIVNIGIGEDGTKEALEKFKSEFTREESKKIKFFESLWPLDNFQKRKGGQILAEQTNLALKQCQGRWCLYLQADEVLHEQDLPLIQKQVLDLDLNRHAEAIVFEYFHFYGSYHVVQTSRSSYRREIRVIQNKAGIQSIGDAQSFRHQDGRKLKGILSKAKVFHYGWVRPQSIMKEKTFFMDSLYHPNQQKRVQTATGENYLYKRIIGLRPFQQTHPKVMQKRILQKDSCFDFSKVPRIFTFKDTWKLLSNWIERLTGHRLFEYKNYYLVKPMERS